MPAIRGYMQGHYAHRGPFDLNRKKKEENKPLDSFLRSLLGKKRKRPPSQKPYVHRRHIPRNEMLRRGYVPVVRFDRSSRAPGRTMYRYNPGVAARMARQGRVQAQPRRLPPASRPEPRKKGMFGGLNATLDNLLGTTPKMKENREKSERGLFGGH
jgi:hypothetical protein